MNSKPGTILLFGIVAYTFSDKLSRNSSTLISHDHSLSLFTSLWVADYYLNYSFSCLQFFGVNFFSSKQIPALSVRFKMERS